MSKVRCPKDATEGWEKPADFLPSTIPQDFQILELEIRNLAVKTVLEFGPGATTEFMLSLGVSVTTCEHVDKFYNEAKKRFKDARVIKYHNQFPVVIEELKDDEKFDMGLVDSPQGYHPIRKVFPGYEDCSRLNTCLFALSRCRFVLLHDAQRPCERGTLGRLNAMGYEYHFLTDRIAVILHGDTYRPNLQSPSESRSTPAGAEPVSGGVSVDIGPSGLDSGGTGKKRRSVRQGRGQQSRGGVRSTSGAHSGVESGPRVRRGTRSKPSGSGDSSGTASKANGVDALHPPVD